MRNFIHSLTIIFPVTIFTLYSGAAGRPAEIEEILQKIEFRGYARIEDEETFSLFHRETGSSNWVRVGQPVYGGRVVSFDPDAGYLKFKYDGGSVTPIRLKRNSGTPITVIRSTTGDVASSRAKLSHERTLKPFSSLSREQQKLLWDPKFIPMLQASRIEVPFALSVQADSERKRDEIRQKNVVVRSRDNGQRPNIPLFGNSLTSEEKEVRRSSLIR